MTRKPCTFRKSDVRRAIELVESLGKRVTAVKFHADGTFCIMTSEHPGNEDKDNSWDDLSESLGTAS